MALTLTDDMIVGIGALIVAAVAIFMFMRATDGVGKPQRREDNDPSSISISMESSRVSVPTLPSVAKRSEVEKARSTIRTLTVQQEILGMVMKRLFEAEDEGEINKEERERLGKNYEVEMQKVTEELTKAELIVSLNELEVIRSDIVKQFQETLTDTQSKIDLIIKELNIQPIEPVVPDEPKSQPKPRGTRPKPQLQPQEDEPDVDEEGTPRRGRETVEERLDKLKQDVLKELEELDRLELEQ
ncbi:hypothetical protein HN807_06755 [Candidatus Bathyarchaeota archaeon]|jgi:hypothetical protein|nr:hypothetical protein [Candidatus Bathyarchaeota archaeon]MBT4321488.1 hypothetical protein [Candidatus Bathyarchaeota archaeon]MBT4424248.1 hypothetical protein [Candidatus Bathyarchaeota archaeon]MBT5642219.1 hypothetical protein [Candidatus Bathyarchaeota archaeon]MBT6603668.1 hypothetical protein [Candidatus Bathyarchaeota archaeon]